MSRVPPTAKNARALWRYQPGEVVYLAVAIPSGAAVNIIDLVVGPDGREQYAITVGPIEVDELTDGQAD